MSWTIQNDPNGIANALRIDEDGSIDAADLAVQFRHQLRGFNLGPLDLEAFSFQLSILRHNQHAAMRLIDRRSTEIQEVIEIFLSRGGEEALIGIEQQGGRQHLLGQ